MKNNFSVCRNAVLAPVRESHTGYQSGGGGDFANNAFLFPLLLAFLCLVACKKPNDEVDLTQQDKPLMLGGVNGASSLRLSYDVVINRLISFDQPITNNSPSWKKLQVVPQSESYSLLMEINGNNFYMLQDNIVLQSALRDRVPVEDRIKKIEVLNGISTTYNSMGVAISSKPTGNLATGIIGGLGNQFNTAPIDTTALLVAGIPYAVKDDKITIVDYPDNGEVGRIVSTFNVQNGRPLLVMSFDDDNPSKLLTMIAHEYDGNGKPLTSLFVYYDYLEDGDVRKKIEKWTYSNFILNLN